MFILIEIKYEIIYNVGIYNDFVELKKDIIQKLKSLIDYYHEGYGKFTFNSQLIGECTYNELIEWENKNHLIINNQESIYTRVGEIFWREPQ